MMEGLHGTALYRSAGGWPAGVLASRWKPILVKGPERSAEKSQAPAIHCTRKSPLPLLPSGPGGVGGKTSRGTDA